MWTEFWRSFVNDFWLLKNGLFSTAHFGIMALVHNRQQLQLEQVGSITQVDNNILARLMYYLNSVCSVVDDFGSLAPNMGRLIDYDRYFLLTDFEIGQVFRLCIMFRPELLIDKCFFEDEEMCGNCNNEFYEITRVNRRMLIEENFIVGDQQVHISKVMFYKPAWMLQNYWLPMAQVIASLDDSDEKKGCCCTIL